MFSHVDLPTIVPPTLGSDNYLNTYHAENTNCMAQFKINYTDEILFCVPTTQIKQNLSKFVNIVSYLKCGESFPI